ncbi:hypothetical protein SMICM17S_07361 [Streptomyces microflavus]
MVVVGLLAVVGAVLASVSATAAGILEPKTQRVATERYLALVARVEMEAVEDDAFHRLMNCAVRCGLGPANAGVLRGGGHRRDPLVAAGGVLAVLHWALLPLLAAMAAPRAWSALSMARHRYVSWHRFVQHVRASQLISRLLIDQQAAGEVRVHDVGPFLLKHFRGMAQTSEREQTRLARIGVRITLGADAAAGLATLTTYGVLGLLLWQGQMALAVAGTAVLAIRTGSASVADLVVRVTDVQGEALFVADLETLCDEAARRAIPTGGRDLPETVGGSTGKITHLSGRRRSPRCTRWIWLMPAAGGRWPWWVATVRASRPWSSCCAGCASRTAAKFCGAGWAQPRPIAPRSSTAWRWSPRTSTGGPSPPG